MTDIFTKKKRSEIMSKIRSKNTKVELLAEKIMKQNNFRKFKRGDHVFGNPDFVFEAKNVAIFVDGGFWHGKNFRKSVKTLPYYWKLKISRNMKRDSKVNKKLREGGWKVLRFWEDQINKTPEKFIKDLKEALENGS